jgi:hypothetical protein
MIKLTRPYTDFLRLLTALASHYVTSKAEMILSNRKCARYVTEPNTGSELNLLREPL